MRRNCFFGLLLALFFAFASMPSAASALDGPANKTRGPSTAAKKTGTQKSGARQGQGEASKGAAGATEISPGQINARSAILVEVSTGTVLFEQNADEPIEPASFTKIATLYLVFEALKQGRIHLNDEVVISGPAWRTGGSKMFVGIGSRVPLEELIKGIAVVSGNDSCVAVAEHVSGSVDTFTDAMNRKAKELGMSRTRFLNPHGLPAEGQITTARDMATLDTAYLKAFPESLGFHSMKEYSYNNIQQYNRNHLLLKDPTIDGLKTGYIAASGYHLSATSKRDGMRLIAVVMGAQSSPVREREALKLLNYGFRHFTLVQPFQEGQAVAKVKVWKGQKDEIEVYPIENATVLIPQSQKNLLKWEIHTPSDATAPIKADQQMGEIVFLVSGQPQRTVALVSREEVPLGGWFKRSWQTVANLHKIDWKWISGVLGGIAIVAILLTLLSGRKSQKKLGK
ncbi:MAG: D-alanyl-D-alanine carboxypeptidase family protein [Syntrophobacteraceae bacterium]|jgi:D-alanyl-D-alanine carboxypeptidase (penicillin-binding protein 5/6)